MTDISKQSDAQVLLYELAESLSSLVIREHQILQDELDQVGNLVGDAVKELGENFYELHACVFYQKSLIGDLENADNKDELQAINSKINSHTSNLKRALQFDDIVQQLAGHASERIGQMQQLFNMLDQDVNKLKSFEIDNKQTQNQLKIMHENISKFRQLLEKENPVKQGSMTAGEIELF